MNSCENNEYNPRFGEVDPRLQADASCSSSSSDDEDNGFFAEARDKWWFPQDDSGRGFFQNTELKIIYCWEIARSILYEFDPETNNCVMIWNAFDTPYLWPMLGWRPGVLPPPVPADAVNAWNFAVTQLIMNLNGMRKMPAREDEIDPTQLLHSVADFKMLHDLHPSCIARLQDLSKVGQVYVMRKFKSSGPEASKAFTRYLDVLERNDSFAPGGLAERSMRLQVDHSGGVLGPHIPELMGFTGLDCEHCQIAFLNGRFHISDLGMVGGTFLNDVRIEPHSWIPIEQGMSIRLGTECVLQVELSDFAVQAAASAAVGVPLQDPSSVENPGPKEEEEPKVEQKVTYRDRAALRRGRCGKDSSAALEGLIKTAKRDQDERDRIAMEKPESKALLESNMRADGSFRGGSAGQHAGLGYADSDLVEPDGLSRSQLCRHRAAKRFKKM